MIGPPTDEPEAPVFDIQSFSLHDGPGIRTTVFFRGCPLRCLWCHNPESRTEKTRLMFHRNLCVGCFLCVGACPYGLHRAVDTGAGLVHQADQARCRGCGACLAVCCYGALDLPGKSFTPRGLYEKIRGDLRYFLLEGEGGRQEGGITFSGGEPMLYAGFIRSFCDLIPGVHRAMETSGHAPRKWFEDILESIDLFLFDYKISNPEKHRRYCGADNALILSNLDFLYSRGKAIVLRFPIIPEINDDDEHFDGIAGLLRRYPAIGRGEIMAYHNLGIGKAEELGMEYPKELPLEGAGKEMAAVWMERLRSRGCANVYQS